MTFRPDNTEGFNKDELDVLNTVLAKLLEPGDITEKSASDLINNAWTSGMDADELFSAAVSLHLYSDDQIADGARYPVEPGSFGG